VPAPTDEALQTVLHKIIARVMKLLTRRGALVEEQGSTHMADNGATLKATTVPAMLHWLGDMASGMHDVAWCSTDLAWIPRASTASPAWARSMAAPSSSGVEATRPPM